MQLVFDLFACQTGSRLRGIGRYNQSLASAMARLRGSHRLIALADGTDTYQASAESLRQDFRTLLPAGDFCCYIYPPRVVFGTDAAAFDAVASALIHLAWRAVHPDAILSNPLEGWHENGTTPLALPPEHGSALQVALLYDFIPQLFPAQYLADPAHKTWYQARLAALARYDLLLAISDATRLDAIRLLGIAPERVVNIAGAVGPQFKPTENLPAARFGIRQRYILYTGNADYRKNLDGMLAAYALLPAPLRASHQLVLNQVGDMAQFRRKTRALGLHDNQVLATGHISDVELIGLYSHCTLFVFPSLYEGFGLPILEAMSCGAAVLAGNNSSMPELVGRTDMLFDASQPPSIAAAMERALGNAVWRAEIAAYGMLRAREFTWERCATLAWQAIEQLAPRTTELPRCRIAIVACLSDASLASTRHCMALLPALAQHLEFDLYTPDATPPRLAHYPHYHPNTLIARREDYATILWQFDDHASHSFMLPLMQAWPGVLVSHAAGCEQALHAFDQEPGQHGAAAAERLRQQGVQALLRDLGSRGVFSPPHDGITLQYEVSAQTDPTLALARYLTALRQAIANAPRHATASLADALRIRHHSPAVLDAVTSHAVSNAQMSQRPRLLVDVTQLAHTDSMTGIQRVVKNIARGLCAAENAAPPVELVQLIEGQLVRASGVISALFGLTADTIPAQPLAIHPGDTLLMIDSSWQQSSDFVPIFTALRRRGGSVVTVVYDLIPLQRPEFFVAPLVAVFDHWFNLAVQHSDMLLCISRSVAEEVVLHLQNLAMTPPRPLAIRWWPLGANLPVVAGQSTVRPGVTQLLDDSDTPLLLMVGTIEPRKNHAFVLDAFELLWQRGVAARLVIAGQAGWNVDDFMRRMRSHPQFGQQLFFIEKFTDAEIALCYRSATALIAASVAEGFGLPIVEAALHGVPVIASDIPVFREVGGDGAVYFSLRRAECLTEAIKQVIGMDHSKRAVMTALIPTMTWEHSAGALLQAIGLGVAASDR